MKVAGDLILACAVMAERNEMESTETQRLTITEEEFLKAAVKFLETPNPLIKAVNFMGAPIERSFNKLPERYSKMISEATRNALYKGVEAMADTIKGEKSENFMQAQKETRNSAYQHTVMAFGVGAVGGMLGMVALPLELPAATAVMLRSILNMAKEFDLDIKNPEVQMECLYILTLGSNKTDDDDSMDSAYWTSRIGFASLINQAAKYIAAHGLKALSGQVAIESAPALVKFLAAIATRYEVVVTKKALGGAIPVIGAIGGGTINAAFTDYFSQGARYHFGIKNLEKKYGSDLIKGKYSAFKEENKNQAQ